MATTAPTTPTSDRTRPVPPDGGRRSASPRTRRTRRLLAVLAAAVAALAVWAVAGPALGVDIVAATGATTAAIAPVRSVLSAAAVGLAGWGLLAVLERVTARPRRVWTAVAVAVLVVSLPAPLLSASSLAAGVTLAAMHLAVGAVLIPLLPRSASR